MHFCMIKTGTKLTDMKIRYMYEYLYFYMYIFFLCRSLTHSLVWLIKRRLIDGLLLQLPQCDDKKHGERKKSVHQWHRGQSKSLSLKLELQVTLEGSNFDLSKFLISWSKTAVPYFYSIKLSKFTPYLLNFRSLEVNAPSTKYSVYANA